ncbi:MAG: CARDB domain-containing protein [Synechococcaceae cyanobacterium]
MLGQNQPWPLPMTCLHIANSVADLVQGDVREHLPLNRIPLEGDVLGLGTTSGYDNGELSFLHQPGEAATRVDRSRPHDGGIDALAADDRERHFPYVCFSDEASASRLPLDPALLGEADGVPLRQLIARALELLRQQGRLEEAPIYGLRLKARWHGLVITVASKLCLGQLRRNASVARSGDSDAERPGASIYSALPHFLLGAPPPEGLAAAIRPLPGSLRWECCGFWDTQPQCGRVTVPEADAHLHLHGCDSELRVGGHLHHEHPGSRLAALERLAIYPLGRLRLLSSDLAVREVSYAAELLRFQVANLGQLDASEVGVDVVVDDRWSSRRHLRLPWLAAGAWERFEMPLALPAGRHELLVCVDPDRDILEPAAQQGNNTVRLRLDVRA